MLLESSLILMPLASPKLPS